MNAPATAIVIGGGCAGIAAAVRLAEHGVAVTLIETRKRLGGRATSHHDPQTGALIDNCQHVVLGCCTNILDLYDRLGSLSAIEWQAVMRFADKAGRAWDFGEDPLPAPLHLTRALMGYRGLSLRDRLRVALAMGAILRADRAAHESRSFAAFLDQHHGSPASVERFWNPIVRSACNLSVEQVSAAAAMQVFQQGFMANRAGWRMGVSRVPLAHLYDRAEAVLNDTGGALRLGTAASASIVEADRVTGVRTTRDEVMRSDVVISALPADRLVKIAPEQLKQRDLRLAAAGRIGTSPIIGMHLWLDRIVLDRSHLFFADGQIDWLFAAPDQPAQGQHLHTGISAAQALVGMDNEALLALAMDELRRYASVLPAAASAKLVRGQVIREKRATIAPRPGLDAHRPTTRGAGSNLLLAGDWTATGWPSTMEGAVRSGYAAAGAALGRELVIDDLPTAPLPRWLGRGV